jgi:hypothetical protein
MMNEASRAETGIPTSEEAIEITKSRFSIIRVCKLWYAIGIKALWSHLRINVRAVDTIQAIKGIQEAIRRDRVLASYIIRITLWESGIGIWEAAADVVEGPLWRLTSRLPSPKIFVFPRRYVRGMANSSLDVAVWRYDGYAIVLHRAVHGSLRRGEE